MRRLGFSKGQLQISHSLITFVEMVPLLISPGNYRESKFFTECRHVLHYSFDSPPPLRVQIRCDSVYFPSSPIGEFLLLLALIILSVVFEQIPQIGPLVCEHFDVRPVMIIAKSERLLLFIGFRTLVLVPFPLVIGPVPVSRVLSLLILIVFLSFEYSPVLFSFCSRKIATR